VSGNRKQRVSATSEKTTVVVFPFDLFGSAGSGAGAALLADELREVLADNRRETVPTRASAYADRVRLREFSFERLDQYEGWRENGRRAVRQARERGDFLLWLTGNHLGALPVYDELSALGERCLVVQLDAHLDIHNFAECTSELSHGNFLLHCAGPLPPLVNVGHRELLLTPDYVRKYFRATFDAQFLMLDPDSVLTELRKRSASAEQVLIDIDCDVLDAAFFPAVARPVPFGLSPEQLLRVLGAVWSERVIGVALSEFDPARDRDDRCLSLLVWLVESLLLRRYE
jgi:arginase family enzyme